MALPLLLAPIVSMLADKGLDVLSKALDIGGDKVVSLVEEKTGIKLQEPEKIVSQDIEKLREFQANHELELLRIALDNKKEDNRHNENIVTTIVGDTQNARGISHLYEMQAEIGRRIFLQTSIVVPILIILDIILIAYSKQLMLSEAMISGTSMLIGVALNNAYRERQSMIEFLYGSSVGSKLKG